MVTITPEAHGSGRMGPMNGTVTPIPVGPLADTKLERLREKKEPSLGEVNPLIFSPDLKNPQAVDAITFVLRQRITQYKGVEPSLMEALVIPTTAEDLTRFVARFEVDTLTDDQVSQLERVVTDIYPAAVRTRRDTSGNALQPTAYHPLEVSKIVKKGRRGTYGTGFMGWYMGSDVKQTSAFHTGLFVYRDIGDTKVADYLRSVDPEQWFFNPDLQTPLGKKLKSSYVVEVREEKLYPPDLIELVSQVSTILGTGKAIDDPKLLYGIYNDLNRLGLRKAQRANIHGLDDAITEIERTLILPLANLDLSTGLELRPSSVLMVGVPGTGKTLVAEYLLQQDSGIFLVPLVPRQLSEDLSKQPQSRVILPRISQVFRKTGIPVVLHLDDVESLGTDNAQMNTTLLNLMAGVREHGFYVIASTNHPEVLSPQLLQPERFSTIVYFGLHDQQSRRGILDIHATSESREMGKELFSPAELRELLLDALSADESTQSFTPRFLAEICTQAKTILLERVSKQRGQKVGLSELDLEDTFSPEDWAQALDIVSKSYNKGEIEKWDDGIKEFMKKHRRAIGLTPNIEGNSKQKFMDTFQRLAARLENPL